MAKAHDIIKMMMSDKMNINAIVIMLKFFEVRKELKTSEVQAYYVELGYVEPSGTENEKIYSLLVSLVPLVEAEFTLDFYKLKDMLWFFCDCKKIITKEQKTAILTMVQQ